ncbi:MAG: amino acid adenylation domain-containing protein [Oscillospiraceae bacterium]|nr:amino acid adenylation domain-containing protein [Oscillospiraceae bacterium]
MRNNVLNYLYGSITRCPDKLAFSDGTEGLTFRQVYDSARSVGSYLIGRGIYKKPVVVFMRKSPREVAAFFGVISGGCWYVPIDEEMPAGRIQLILDNVKSPLVICDEDTAPIAKDFVLHGGSTVLYSEICTTPADETGLARVLDSAIDIDPIYIVFTSGSTGIPKGVAACHRSVIEYVEQLSETLGFNSETVFGNQSPLYFDACLKELYPTLKFGATTYLIPRKLFSLPVQLIEFMNEHKINTICWVVSALTMISAFDTFSVIRPEYLHTIAFGSEVFPLKQFRRWRQALPEASFTNLYGPTEATGMTCFYHVDREFEDGEPIPIGRPFPNRQVLLLSDDGTETAPGEIGEIYVRGTSVTLGYYNDPERTSQAYVPNPLNTAYPEIIYKTGDLARYNDRGELVYVSRRDHQIKHMGHRVELGEVEVNVNMLPGIKLSACIYDAEKKKIVLYYLGDQTDRELTELLKTKLPRYMLPGRIIRLEEMPFTPNGKIDRVTLKKIYENK